MVLQANRVSKKDQSAELGILVFHIKFSFIISDLSVIPTDRDISYPHVDLIASPYLKAELLPSFDHFIWDREDMDGLVRRVSEGLHNDEVTFLRFLEVEHLIPLPFMHV
jgi:hypothetical protein